MKCLTSKTLPFLARARKTKVSIPIRHPTEQLETIAREIHYLVEDALKSCRKLIKQLFS